MALLHEELTGQIIGAYYDVYNGTSRTYPEWVYERAMVEELRLRGIQQWRQPEYEISYKDKVVGRQQLDLFVAREVVVELKVARRLTKLHKAQALSYLKAVGKRVGLLFNFGSSRPEFERLYYEESAPSTGSAFHDREWGTTILDPVLTFDVIGGLYEVHSTLGPGFIHRIYANAAYHELRLRDLPVQPHREFHVFYRGRIIGQLKFKHLQVGDDLMAFPVALQNADDLNIHNLKAWMQHQQIPLGILANFQKPSLEIKLIKA